MATEYKAVIGLEVHAQLASQAKIYCADEAGFGGQPNTRVSPVSLGHPGTLPTLNEECLRLAIKMGLATGCTIAERCYFARKNYFYPDLPKGYQISQDKTPLCVEGVLNLRLANGPKQVRIQRIHLEEDAGKSLHDQDPFATLVDLNRASVGLVEIVSHPDMDTAEEAMAYLTEVRKLVRYLGICDGNMEEGSLRCDANVSVMPAHLPRELEFFGIRAEVKNMNSISNVGRAINYEVERQVALLEAGGQVARETRTWDAVANRTFAMRDKESADDYRYFPEPDLQPMVVTEALKQELHQQMPALPEVLYQRFVQDYALPQHDATLLTEQREFAAYFMAVVAAGASPRAASNWMNGSVKNYLNEQAVEIMQFPLQATTLATMIAMVEQGKISHTTARDQLFPKLLAQPTAQPQAIAATHNLLLQHDTGALAAHIETVLRQSPAEVSTYLGGKVGLLGFFVGQVMKAAGGKADPKLVNQQVREALEKQRS